MRDVRITSAVSASYKVFSSNSSFSCPSISKSLADIAKVTRSSKAKMKTTLLTLTASAIALVRADYGYQFSNALSTGPTADNSWIREANTTLVLPAINTPQTGNLALWPGMATSGGDLVQALAISHVVDGATECPGLEGKWCVVASTLETSQEMGEYVAADPGAHVTFHCE